MGLRKIAVSDEAYERLASLKKEGESITDVILRLCSNHPAGRPLATFAGKWIMSNEEERSIFGEVGELWRKCEESMLGHGLPSRVAEKSSGRR